MKPARVEITAIAAIVMTRIATETAAGTMIARMSIVDETRIGIMTEIEIGTMSGNAIDHVPLKPEGDTSNKPSSC